MKLVTLIYGVTGALWRDKLCKAFERLRSKLVLENVHLEIWGVGSAGRIDQSSGLVKETFDYKDAQSMQALNAELDKRKVGLAVIASPNEKHLKNLDQVADRVPYIIVEKPLAESTESAKAALDLQKSSKTSICKGVDHYIAKPAVRELLKWAQNGRLTSQIGSLRDVRFSMLEKRKIDPLRVKTLNAGLTYDLMTHGFSLLDRLFRALGLPAQVLKPGQVVIENAWAGQYVDSPIHGETASRIEVSIADDLSATLTIGKGIMNDKRLILRGTKDTLVVDIAEGSISAGIPGTESEVLFEGTADAYETLLEEAIRAALARQSGGTRTTECLIDFEEAVNALALVEKAREQFKAMMSYQPGTIPRVFTDCQEVAGVTVETCDNREGVERAILREMLSTADEAIDQSGEFVLVVPGGSSFLGIGRLLAYGAIDADLSKWQIFFSDEHAGLPHGADESNCRMLLEGGGFGGLIYSGRLRPEQLHRIVTEDSGEALEEGKFASRLAEYEAAYEKCLRSGDKEKAGADLMIVGLGADCHTASLIPSWDGFASPLLTSKRHFDMVMYPESYGLSSSLRGSVTMHGIKAAKRVVLLAFGDKKKRAIRDSLTEPIDLAARPGSVIQKVQGTLITDRAGSRLL